MALSATLFCSFCSKCEDETELVDMESNSLKYGSDILEFSDLILDVFNFKVLLKVSLFSNN